MLSLMLAPYAGRGHYNFLKISLLILNFSLVQNAVYIVLRCM